MSRDSLGHRVQKALLIGGVAGCGATAAMSMGPDFSSFTPPEAIAPRLEAASRQTKDELVQAHRVAFKNLGYDPSRAEGLSCIQEKRDVALDREELGLFAKNGFATSRERPYPSFALAYLMLYKDDLPVFVSADAILHAWHRSYDDLLVMVERGVFTGSLDELLGRMRKNLGATQASAEVRAELDTYLTIAHSLLKDQVLPARDGSAERVQDAFGRARAAASISSVRVFGRSRLVDFTQWKPRGHYEKHPDLIPYFRAMMWLGTVDFRPIETSSNGERHFEPLDFHAFVAARETMDDGSLALWRSIDRLVSFFVGAHDNLTPEGLAPLARDLGAKTMGALQHASDARVEQAIVHGGYGKQRIMSYVAWKAPGTPELALNTSFALFGQRYSLDSHTLTAVTEDRVPDRQLPTPGDVAFATFGNDFALALASPQDLNRPAYVSALAGMRALADAQNDDYWLTSLYSSWIWALRGLSPDLEHAPAASVTRTEAWSRRLLATQLASWSELRHDSILYAKQSYSVGILCKYPDAYVEPYPAVFHRLVEQSALALRLVAGFDRTFLNLGQVAILDSAHKYFERAKEILSRLEAMSQKNAKGEHLSSSDLAFLNDMIKVHTVEGGCGGGVTSYDGWYRELLGGASVTDPDVTVADIHTSLEAGVLHIGKQLPRRIVVSVDWADGARAYVGAAYSYHELVSEQRLNDSEWSALVLPEPAWLAPVVAHADTAP